MPCKRAFSQACIRETGVSRSGKAQTSEAKTRFRCIAEAHESTRQRIESVTRRIHDGHIAGKGQNSVLHYNSVHKFIPMLQAMRITDAKAAVDKGWKKLETLPAWKLESQEQKGGHRRRHRKTTTKFTLLLWWTFVIYRIPSWSHNFRGTK